MDTSPFGRPPVESDDLASELLATARRFAAQPVPRPSAAETDQLLHVLLAEAAFAVQDTHGHDPFWQVPVVARWRVYLLGPWFWIAGVLFLLAGMLLARYLTVADLITLLILLLPLTSVLGVTHALRVPSAGLRAVEASCPVNGGRRVPNSTTLKHATALSWIELTQQRYLSLNGIRSPSVLFNVIDLSIIATGKTRYDPRAPHSTASALPRNSTPCGRMMAPLPLLLSEASRCSRKA